MLRVIPPGSGLMGCVMAGTVESQPVHRRMQGYPRADRPTIEQPVDPAAIRQANLKASLLRDASADVERYYKLDRHAELARRDRVAAGLRYASVTLPPPPPNGPGALPQALASAASATRSTPVLPSSLLHALQHAPVRTDSPEPGVQGGADVAAEPVPDGIVVEEQIASQAWLDATCPTAAIEFELAADRLGEAADFVGAKQSGLIAQALESLRRGINALADELVPPQDEPMVDEAGIPHPAGSRDYKNRLYVAFKEGIDSKSGAKLELIELESFDRRLQALVARIAAGVHGYPNHEEGRQLYVDVWRLVSSCRMNLG